jgi:hypothetical protein
MAAVGEASGLDIVIVLVFASLILVIAAVVFFVARLREGDFDHGERLSLLPLAEDGAPVSAPQAAGEVPDPQEQEEDSPHGQR